MPSKDVHSPKGISGYYSNLKIINWYDKVGYTIYIFPFGRITFSRATTEHGDLAQIIATIYLDGKKITHGAVS